MSQQYDASKAYLVWGSEGGEGCVQPMLDVSAIGWCRVQLCRLSEGGFEFFERGNVGLLGALKKVFHVQRIT